VILYQIHEYSLTFYKKNYTTAKFVRLLEKFYDDGLRINLFISFFFKTYKFFLYTLMFNYVRVYNSFIKKIYRQTYFYFKKIKDKKKRYFYNLILTFSKEKFFINLANNKKKTHLFLSTGFFIKYFNKKKLYKKSKIIRTFLIRYLRKIFLLIKISKTILTLKKTPVLLYEFLKIFSQPIPYKFNEPLTNREIKDAQYSFIPTKFKYFIFVNSENYTFSKTKKKGRVKRKIYRKIVLHNSIID
jgi:hypothetical protein